MLSPTVLHIDLVMRCNGKSLHVCWKQTVTEIQQKQNCKWKLPIRAEQKFIEQTITLNAFGSAWGNIPVNESMPLGEYQVIFYDSEKRSIGSASLFRLEEYKLPEFQVTIQTPEENGKKKSFRLGETVDVNIQAEYYFGGPVANANVEVVIYQNPFHHWWYPHHEYSWFYEDFQQQRTWYGQGQIMKRETLKQMQQEKQS